MKTQINNKQTFRQFRVGSICSTANPDAILNESGLDDFVAGKATGAAGEKAKELGGKAKEKIDPTKAGRLKRVEKGEKKQEHKEKVKKLQDEIKSLSKEVSTGKTDPLGDEAAKEKVRDINQKIKFLKKQISTGVKLEINDAGRAQVVKGEDGKKVELDDKAISKLEDQVKERELDIKKVGEPRELNPDQVKAKREQLKDKQTELKKAKLTDPTKESVVPEVKNFGQFVAEKREQVSEAKGSAHDTLDALRTIVRRHQADKIKLLNGKQISVDAMTANAMVKVYDALNTRNKVKFASTLAKDLAGFHKMSAFAIKNVSY